MRERIGGEAVGEVAEATKRDNWVPTIILALLGLVTLPIGMGLLIWIAAILMAPPVRRWLASQTARKAEPDGFQTETPKLRQRNRLLDIGAIILGLLMVFVGAIGLLGPGPNHIGYGVAGMLLPPGVLILPFTIAWLRRRGFPDNAFLHIAMVFGAFVVGVAVTMPFIPPAPPQAARPAPNATPPVAGTQPASRTAKRPPSRRYTIVGPSDALAPAQEALNAGDHMRAYQLFAYPPVTDAQRSSPQGVALHTAIQAEADRAVGVDGGGEAADRVATYYLPQIESLPITPPTTVAEIWSREDALEEAAKNLQDSENTTLTPAQTQVRNRYRAAIVAKQRVLLPILRAAFVRLFGAQVWEQNMDVRIGGTGNRTVTFTAGAFADRAQIAAAQRGMEPNLAKLRFNRAAYEWARGVGEVYTYKMSPPADDVIGIWDGGSFTVVH